MMTGRQSAVRAFDRFPRGIRRQAQGFQCLQAFVDRKETPLKPGQHIIDFRVIGLFELIPIQVIFAQRRGGPIRGQ